MSKVNQDYKLPMEPNNDIWINCIYNNLIAILKIQNQSYGKLSYSLSRNYSIYQFKNKFNAPEVEMKIFGEGIFVPEVLTQIPKIQELFDVVEVEYWNFPSVHEAIMTYLEMGYYLFVDLDRFYFPGGIEYNVRRFIHPSFVYGYNRDLRKYYMIEDCTKPRVLNYYELSHDQLEAAFDEIRRKGEGLYSKTGIKAYKLISTTDYKYKITKNDVITNLENLLTESQDDSSELCKLYDLNRIYGLNCIRQFSSAITDLFPRISSQNIVIHYALASFPLDFQKSNLILVDILFNEGLLSEKACLHLREQYIALSQLWTRYRNNIFYYIQKKEINPDEPIDPSYFLPLSTLLNEIYHKETLVTQYFLETLQSS